MSFGSSPVVLCARQELLLAARSRDAKVLDELAQTADRYTVNQSLESDGVNTNLNLLIDGLIP